MKKIVSAFCCFIIPVIVLSQENADNVRATKHHFHNFTYSHGAIVRGDSTKKKIALVFTADEFGEGLPAIIKTLQNKNIKAGFFLTGRFYRNKNFHPFILELNRSQHYLGPHSDEHVLYNDWNNRDSLLITHSQFEKDIQNNLATMRQQNIVINHPHYFIPPYEWWNDSIAEWSKASNLQVINFSAGIRSNVDYTYPEMGDAYKNNEWIIQSIKELQKMNPNAFNGAIILIHAGTDTRRKDKLYNRLGEIIDYLKSQGYVFIRVDKLLQ